MLDLAAIFKDGMILQQNARVAVFGDTDCDKVEVEFEGISYTSNIEEGHFIAIINTDDSRKLCKLNVTGCKTDKQEKISISDILLGEVWLDGGQSNMELELQNSLNGQDELKAADYDQIRFYKVPKYPLVDEGLLECEKNTAWKSLRDGKCADMSAVAYYFATRLYEALKVPIGIIDCYQGGTSATCWVSKEMLDEIPEVTGYVKEWEDEINSKSDEQYAREMEEYNASLDKWQKTVDQLKAENPDIEMVNINKLAGPYPWPLPRGKASVFRPYGLHKSMINRIAPYTVKGFIYYQAEEDCDRADYYSKLNSAVIKQWRKDFSLPGEEETKPFFLMQLPMFIAADVEDDKKWCILREQQYLCSQTNANVGMAVIADCGEYDNIHPLDKKTPGQRLAARVLADVYEYKEGLHNFVISSAQHLPTEDGNIEDRKYKEAATNAVELTFEDSYGSICYRESDGLELTALKENIELSDGKLNEGTVYGFEISNNGEDFYQPDIAVKSDRLILSGQPGQEITDVRYGWFNYGVANLYSKAGMPLMPFWKKTTK